MFSSGDGYIQSSHVWQDSLLQGKTKVLDDLPAVKVHKFWKLTKYYETIVSRCANCQLKGILKWDFTFILIKMTD